MPDYNTVSSIVGQFVPAQYVMLVSYAVLFFMVLCSFLSSQWARPKDGSWLLPIYTLLNRIALNVKHAKNADDVQEGKK